MNRDFSILEGFGWDSGNLEHIKKHKVNYRECEEVFLNRPIVLNRDETHFQQEERFRIYGQTNEKKLLCVIFTMRGNNIRVISARNQNKKERKEYQEVGGEQV